GQRASTVRSGEYCSRPVSAAATQGPEPFSYWRWSSPLGSPSLPARVSSRSARRTVMLHAEAPGTSCTARSVRSRSRVSSPLLRAIAWSSVSGVSKVMTVRMSRRRPLTPSGRSAAAAVGGAVRVDDAAGQVAQLGVLPLRGAHQAVEGSGRVHAHAFHEDAGGLTDEVPGAHGLGELFPHGGRFEGDAHVGGEQPAQSPGAVVEGVRL